MMMCRFFPLVAAWFSGGATLKYFQDLSFLVAEHSVILMVIHPFIWYSISTVFLNEAERAKVDAFWG